MKLGRRDFLKLLGLGAAGAVLAPSAALEELTHGASDLTPRERDAVAEVMGLRREQWAGWDTPGCGRLSVWTVDSLGMKGMCPTWGQEILVDGVWHILKTEMPWPGTWVDKRLLASYLMTDEEMDAEDALTLDLRPGTRIVGTGNPSDRPSFTFGDVTGTC